MRIYPEISVCNSPAKSEGAERLRALCAQAPNIRALEKLVEMAGDPDLEQALKNARAWVSQRLEILAGVPAGSHAAYMGGDLTSAPCRKLGRFILNGFGSATSAAKRKIRELGHGITGGTSNPKEIAAILEAQGVVVDYKLVPALSWDE